MHSSRIIYQNRTKLGVVYHLLLLVLHVVIVSESMHFGNCCLNTPNANEYLKNERVWSSYVEQLVLGPPEVRWRWNAC